MATVEELRAAVEEARRAERVKYDAYKHAVNMRNEAEKAVSAQFDADHAEAQKARVDAEIAQMENEKAAMIAAGNDRVKAIKDKVDAEIASEIAAAESAVPTESVEE